MPGCCLDSRRLLRLQEHPRGSGAELGTQRSDCFGYVTECLLVFVQDRSEGLEAMGAVVGVVFADQDSDQMSGTVEAAPEIVVLASGAVEEGPEMHEPFALDLVSGSGAEYLGFVGAQPLHIDLVLFADSGKRLDRVQQLVPKRE